MSDPTAWLNAQRADEAQLTFHRCCASTAWAREMTASRPYADPADLQHTAEAIWWELARADWLEAFAGHPRIGASMDSLRERFGSTAAWASHEQAGAQAASEDVLERLAEGNRAYEARFGYIFIVCATGNSAAEMLALLEARMGNTPEDELRVAAGEQMKITALRLAKLTPPPEESST